jgi:iron complex outermembrane receptor protein
MRRVGLLSGISGLALCAVMSGGAAFAAETGAAASGAATATAADGPISEIVVTADRVGLIEKKPSSTVFGFDKSLLETPRSATFVSDTTLERYGIVTIDNLVEISPSSYTASFYGVPGSLNIRGTLAEDYFEGFKRVENRGTYSTPIGDASEVEVVRGPPNVNFGAGKVGGLLNFIPKTAKDTGAYLTAPAGEIDITGGSYDKQELTAQGGAPVSLGAVQGGVYGYLDVDDSHSYYHGIYPKRQTAEISGDFNLPDGWTTAFQGMVYHSDGDVQTAGWNRITQNLIDNGTYTTGRNTSIVDLNGDGKIESNEPGYFPYGGAYSQLICYYYGCTNAVHQLTTDVGTAKLSPQTVLVSQADMSRTTTYTTYFKVAKKLTDKSDFKLELFYDDLNNERFVSYGFPASYQTYIAEGRATYDFAQDFLDGAVKTKSFVGLGYRYTDAHLRESFNSGIIALDRRDLVEGPSATDIIASPFNIVNGQPGWPWELDVHSNIRDAGAFLSTDITLLDKLDVIFGGRDDSYSVASNDLGVLAYETAHAAGDKSKATYNISVSYKLPYGLIPYYTYDQAAALELDQASDLQPGTIAKGPSGWLSDSYLSEAGVKFQELNSTLVGSVSAYRQTRTQLVQGAGGPSTIQGTLSKGVEFELRYLVTKHISLTYAGDIQHTEVKGPDSSFVYVTPGTQGVSGVNGYGGSYAATISALPGRAGDYNYAIIPHSVNSLYATYTSDMYDWGKFGVTAGGTHVSKTSMLVQNPVVYPDYWLANLSGFYQYGPYTLSVNIDNLFDKLYFTPNADPTYANVAALPGVGREWRIKLKRTF